MKSRFSIPSMIMAFLLVLTGVAWIANPPEDSPSFRQQMGQLVALRDAGEITQGEYRSRKRSILSLMLH